MTEIQETEQPDRRRRAGWLLLAAATTAFALVVSTLSLVVAGPLTIEAQATVVPSPSPSASPSPQGPSPAPAITASSSTEDDEGVSLFNAPQVTIKPPPPPPTTKGVRLPTTSGGTSPYLGMSASAYCALKLPAFATSGSDPTAFLYAANKERAQTGAPALSWNSTLASFAQNWSNQMASDHTATGYTPGSAEWYAGVFRHSGGPYAENIAFNMGYSNPVNVAQSGWMGSTGHCLNIMNPNYSQMGAGKAQAADGSWFFTEEFTW